jgi:hypothetical protein
MMLIALDKSVDGYDLISIAGALLILHTTFAADSVDDGAARRDGIFRRGSRAASSWRRRRQHRSEGGSRAEA